MNILGYSLIITNQNNESVDLYDDPDLFVTSIDGVDLDAEVNTTTQSGVDGSIYNNTTIPQRVLSFKVQYKYTTDDEAAKLRVHTVCAPKQELTVRMITPHRDLSIKGYCEKCDSPPNTYPMVTSITIICPNPWWNLTNEEEKEVTLPGSIYYLGDVDTGFVTTITFTADTKKVVMITNGKKFVCDTNITGGFSWHDPLGNPPTYKAGDVLVIDSRVGNKIVYLKRDSMRYERYIDTIVGLLYPMLKRGNNTITFEDSSTFTAKATYTEKYRG